MSDYTDDEHDYALMRGFVIYAIGSFVALFGPLIWDFL